ncbi:MAG: hypothetical protein M3Q39_01595 [Actinomycetota bacterium]|nr:hypothetical protein [Actinomycetota bacterium]
MAMPRYLANILGRDKMVPAISTSAGAADAEKIVATAVTTGILDDSLMGAATTGVSKVVKTLGTGLLDASIMPTGIGPDTVILASSENLAAGDLVNIWNNAAVPTARKADGTAEGKECVGFVLAATTSPANATVYLEGKLTGLSGMTPGARQYMSTTAGARTETAPNATGNVIQFVGIAISATIIDFEKAEPITVA